MKNKYLPILVIFILFYGIISCKSDSPEKIIRKVEKEYKNEYGSDLIMHRETEKYKGMEIYRFTGWTVEEERKFTEINSDEWIVIFCENKKYQIIKHTAFMPMDSIAKRFGISCNPN